MVLQCHEYLVLYASRSYHWRAFGAFGCSPSGSVLVFFLLSADCADYADTSPGVIVVSRTWLTLPLRA